MPERPPGAGMNTNSGNVPAVPDTSSFRVVSRASDGDVEPPPITRTSMAAIEGRRRSKRRVVGAIIVTAGVLILAAGIYLVYSLTTGDASAPGAAYGLARA